MVDRPDGTERDQETTRLVDRYLSLREQSTSEELEAFVEEGRRECPRFGGYISIARRLEDLSSLLGNEDTHRRQERLNIGRFEIIRPLGQGGLSRVFLAYDQLLHRKVALKLLHPGIAAGDGRLVAEGAALAQVEHRSIVRVFDVGLQEGVAHISMEYVEGATLAEVLRMMRGRRGDGEVAADDGTDSTGFAVRAAASLESIAQRCRLVLQIADALQVCHERNIVHRDLKPSNILVDREFVPKLIDFGIAHLDSLQDEDITKRLVGTPAYLAPEQIEAGQTGANPKSDQFSLGVVFYELLTLQHPFRRPMRQETLTAISRANPTPLREINPELPIDVERICLKCLELEPGQRYASISACASDLEAFVSHRAISICPPTNWGQAKRSLKRMRRPVIGATLVSVALVLVWLTTRLRDRAMFRDRLNTEQERLSELRDSHEFERVFDLMKTERVLAQSCDRVPLIGWIGSSLEEELDQLWSETVERLRPRLEKAYEALELTAKLKKRLRVYGDAFAEWSLALRMAEAAGPAGESHLVPRFGMIDLPETGVLLRYRESSAPSFPEFEGVEDRRRLRRGIYRYQEWVGGIMRERDFFFDPLQPPSVLRAQPCMPWLEEMMRPVPERQLANLGRQSDQLYFQQAYRICEEVVKWGDVRRVFEKEEISSVVWLLRDYSRRVGVAVSLSDTDPARLPWGFAQEYARRVGARIPTPVELWIAHREGVVRLASKELLHEWTSTPFWGEGNERFVFKYTQLREPNFDGEHWLESVPEDAMVPSVGFRVALSASP